MSVNTSENCASLTLGSLLGRATYCMAQKRAAEDPEDGDRKKSKSFSQKDDTLSFPCFTYTNQLAVRTTGRVESLSASLDFCGRLYVNGDMAFAEIAKNRWCALNLLSGAKIEYDVVPLEFDHQCVAILPKMTRVFAGLAVTSSGQTIESTGLVAEAEDEVIDVKFDETRIFVRESSGTSKVFLAPGKVMAVAFSADARGIRVKTMGHSDSIIDLVSGMHYADFMPHAWLETPNSGVFMRHQIMLKDPMAWLCGTGRHGHFGGPNACDGVFMMVVSPMLCKSIGTSGDEMDIE